MELVYLWVEDYKNIHEQGFNFSPKFNCHYDGETLTINENIDEEGNKQYIENFFGDNINITAIVGKNGSGKSSVLKLILFLIFCKNYKKYEKEGDFKIIRFLPALKMFSNKELFLIIHNGKEFKKITFSGIIRHLQEIEFGDPITTKMFTGSSVREEILFHIPEIKKDELDFFTIHFNYMLDTFYDGQHDEWIKYIYHKSDSYEVPLLLEPFKNNNNRQIIDLETIEYLNNQNMLRFYSKLYREDSDKKFVEFFTPNKINLKLSERENVYQLNPLLPGGVPSDSQTKKYALLKPIKLIIYKYFKLKDKFKNGLEKQDYSIAEEIDKLYKENEYQKINTLYIIFKTLESEKSFFNKGIYEEFEQKFNNIQDLSEILNIDYSNLLLEDISLYEIYKIQIALDFEAKKIFENNSFIEAIGKIKKIEDIQNIMNVIPSWFDIEWFENMKSIKSLSSGEKSFFVFLINLMYQVENINDELKYNTINILLDETELGFHPQWQKEYLKNIIQVLKKLNRKNINLILATHSPFFLSDIPKENIIFLDTYKKEDKEVKNQEQVKGNCKVLSHDEVLSKNQTFGANIHTLLSYSFFMEDGLMGEFAKNKIQEIMDYLNSIKTIEEISTKEEQIKQVIESIGEPFLKRKLLDMYYAHPQYQDESLKEARKKELEAQKRQIEEELKRL